MNNKPVAYGMLTFCKNCGEHNPYKYKELTDEEIEEIGKEYGIKSVYQFAYYEFAKAILRKAQKK